MAMMLATASQAHQLSNDITNITHYQVVINNIHFSANDISYWAPNAARQQQELEVYRFKQNFMYNLLGKYESLSENNLEMMSVDEEQTIQECPKDVDNENGDVTTELCGEIDHNDSFARSAKAAINYCNSRAADKETLLPKYLGPSSFVSAIYSTNWGEQHIDTGYEVNHGLVFHCVKDMGNVAPTD